MGLNEKSLELLSGIVRTEEDLAAFEAGYSLAKDPENNATFVGPVDGRYDNGVAVSLDDKASNTWTAERRLPRGAEKVMVAEPAFVLGAMVAALEYKTAPQTV